jgi:phosphatidylserine/phosphatidylglycerophosphate/cardiolipin synthase-like enzyme
MPKHRTIHIFFKRSAFAVIAYIAAVLGVTTLTPPPSAVAMFSPPADAVGVRFLADSSWLDDNGDRQIQQQIFDEVFALVNDAHSYLLIDMFLFNDWQGPVPENHRALSGELTQTLITRKQDKPSLEIIFITDPVNSIYQGLESKHLEALRTAGVTVVETDLAQLQDSNAFYSALWRLFIKPFGNARADTIKNPIGEGRVSMRSVLAMANFKANHRKLIVADLPDKTTRAIVMSANPHDGSSAHRNVALAFSGNAALDLMQSEIALMELSAQANNAQLIEDQLARLNKLMQPLSNNIEDGSMPATLQVLNESLIRERVIQTYDEAGPGDRIDLLMFYLSDRGIINAMKAAHQRGASLRVLLDVNQDAFGRTKNGVPNRPVAAELVDVGIKVNWCATKGEQCHGKMLLWENTQQPHQLGLLLGSGNYTRRNLQDFNLETNMLLLAPKNNEVMTEAQRYFDVQWQNDSPGRTYTHAYTDFADSSARLKIEYRLREATGFGTF